jgi:hypothetical protein
MTKSATIPTNLTLPADDGILLPANTNNPPEPTPFELITQEINDLFDEAKHWADGEPIADEATHDAISKLYDSLHDAGKRADALRVEEKKPHDDAVKEIQGRYNPFIQDKKGKVAMGKSALGDLLAAWRKKKADEAAAKAREIAAQAAEEQRKAQAAMQATSGNLEARVEAEQLVENAKAWEKAANRANKAATTGLGLRTVWCSEVQDVVAALDWAYARDEGRFLALVKDMADEAVRSGVRSIPGVKIWDEKRAA